MAGDFKVRVGNTPVKNITEIKEENAWAEMGRA
jgi:hypothetical protein